MNAIEQGRLQAGHRRAAALDCASTEFFKDGKYVYEGEGKTRTRSEQAKYLADLVARYPIVSIEDGMSEDDLDGWKEVTDLIGSKCQLVGDDLFVTNVKRLADGIKGGRANSILIKVNQIGTLTETLAAVEMAYKAAYTAVMSHRSGETEDSTIADLAVATGCGQIKTGSLARSDRTAKYNQLLRIEQELGTQAKYAGRGAIKGQRLRTSERFRENLLEHALACSFMQVHLCWRPVRAAFCRQRIFQLKQDHSPWPITSPSSSAAFARRRFRSKPRMRSPSSRRPRSSSMS